MCRRLSPAWFPDAYSGPKVHLVDFGLAGALSGLTTDRVSSRDPALLTEFGHLLETFVVGRSCGRPAGRTNH